MGHGHNGVSGTELLGKSASMHSPAPKKEIFVHKPGGGAGRRKPADPGPSAQEDYGPEPLKEEKAAKKEATVTLSNPKWGGDKGVLDEKIKMTVEGVLPADCKDITKVEFEVFLVHANGKRDPVSKGEGHLDEEGKAEGEVELKAPGLKPGEKPPEKYQMIFTAKHSRSKAVESGKLEVKEGPEFVGTIFYAPARKEYLVLDNEKDAKEWIRKMNELSELRGQSDKARTNPDPKAREKEQLEIAEKSKALFGDKVIGRSGVLEELVGVKFHEPWGKTETWTYVPKDERAESGDKHLWKKADDPKLKKPLEKELQKASDAKDGKDSAKKPVLKTKLKYQLFKGKNVPKIGQWPWDWHDDTTKGENSEYFSFSAEAAVCRFAMGWSGAEATLDLKKKKLELGTSGSISYGLFEGEMKGSVDFPDKDGLDLLYYVRKSDSLNKAIVSGRQCRLKMKLTLTGSTFTGCTLSGALAFPSLDFGEKKSASAGAEVSGFLGAQVNGKAQLSVEWAGGGADLKFGALGEISGKEGFSAGIGAEAKWKLEYKGGKFQFTASAGLAFGLGVKGGFSFEVGVKEGKDFASYLLHSVDYHYVFEVSEEAYRALTNYSFAKMVHAGHWIDGKADQAMGLVADFDYWLNSNRHKIEVPKERLTEAAAQRSSLRFSTPHAIGQALIAIMQTRETSDFKSIMWMLYSAESKHKLEWILRVVSQKKIAGTGVVEIKTSQAEALKAGAEKIRAFGIGPDPLAANTEFLNEFDALLKSKGIG
jgi:hypothetical protein